MAYTNDDIPDLVAAHKEFSVNKGNCSAQMLARMPSTGSLSGTWAEDLRLAFQIARMRNESIYVVFSYYTPIAWFYRDRWTMPSTTYSATTSRQQHLVRMGISRADEKYIDE